MRIRIEFAGDTFKALWHAGVEAIDVAIRRALAGEEAEGQDGGSEPSRKARDEAHDTGKPPATTSPSDPRSAGGGPA